MKVRCGKWMQTANEPCASGAGHKNRCRTAAAVEKQRAQQAVWRAANPAYNAAYVAANRPARRAYRAAAANRPAILAGEAARRAARDGAPFTITPAYWADLPGRPCIYCGAPATEIDRVIAGSRGGGYTPDNVVPSCRPCNTRKGALSAAEWLARLEQPPCRAAMPRARQLCGLLAGHSGQHLTADAAARACRVVAA